MAKRATSTARHLPGMEPAPPAVDRICGVVRERFKPVAESTSLSGPLGLHGCVNVALGMDAGWPAVAYWEYSAILKFHERMNGALTTQVGPVDVWAADPRRSRAEVIDAIKAVAPALGGVVVPEAVTRRSYLAKRPGTRRYLPDVAVAGVALWWSRKPDVVLVDVLGQLKIDAHHTPWEVLSLVDRRIRRTKPSETFATLATELLARTRLAIKAGVTPSPAHLLWHIASRE